VNPLKFVDSSEDGKKEMIQLKIEISMRNIYIHIYTHIHIYIHIYIHFYVHIFVQLGFNLSNGVTDTLESSSILIYLVQVKGIYMQQDLFNEN